MSADFIAESARAEDRRAVLGAVDARRARRAHLCGFYSPRRFSGMSDVAIEIIQAFVVPPKKERLLTLLGSKKGRPKVRRALAHFRDLDHRYAQRLDPSQHTSGAIITLLKERGAPANCYLLSEDADLDGCELPLEEAVEKVRGKGMGTFISCIPGRLAYFEAEDVGERYLLERRT